MQTRRLWRSLLIAGLVMGHVASASAASLASQLARFLKQGFALPDTITPVIVRLGAQGTDFPVPPTTPGYVFVYNPQQRIFERFEGSLGPVFLERVETLGQNHMAFGVSYLYGNVDEFDGDSLAQGTRTVIGAALISPSAPGVVTNSGTLLDSFQLPTNKINFAVSYGITDQWDVGLLVPFVTTNLQAEGRLYFALGATPPSHCGPTTNCLSANLSPLDSTAEGLGDLLLRTKYRFGYLWDWGVAGGLVLRFPTGNEDNFQGLGDWTVQPQLIISRAFGVQDVHLNLGIELNADDLTRTRARYGIGATLSHPHYPWLALLIDFLGSSGLDDEEFTTTAGFQPGVQPVRILSPFATTSRLNPDNSLTVISTLPRTDQFNAALGLKFEIWQNFLGYANAIVPLTRQGLQANVISAVGVEYSF